MLGPVLFCTPLITRLNTNFQRIEPVKRRGLRLLWGRRHHGFSQRHRRLVPFPEARAPGRERLGQRGQNGCALGVGTRPHASGNATSPEGRHYRNPIRRGGGCWRARWI